MDAVRNVARSLGKQNWFAWVGRQAVPVDLALQRRTRGRVSFLRVLGLPYLLLTAAGRKSGEPRSVPLLYAPHGDALIVVGSNWGQRHHPAWSANLLANPEATVTERGRHKPVRARLLAGAERDEVWRHCLAVWPAYDTYARRAPDRELRVFALDPR